MKTTHKGNKITYRFSTIKNGKFGRPSIKDTPLHNLKNFNWVVEQRDGSKLINFVISVGNSASENIYIDTYELV